MSYDTLMEKLDGHAYSHYFTALCPFEHDGTRETEPSLFVYQDGSFRCASPRCSAKFGKHAFLERRVGGDFTPAARVNKVIPKFKKWEEKYEDIDGIARHAHRFLKTHKQYQQYLIGRKMDWAIEPGMFGFLDGWLTLPVKSPNGHLIDIVCRSMGNSAKTRYALMQRDGKDMPPLYSPNWERVLTSDTVYVPFGILDAWTFEALDLPAVTSCAGLSYDVAMLKDLDRCYMFVPDRGENDAAIRLVNQLGWRGDYVRLDYPDNCKDPDEVRRYYGNTALLNLLGA